MESARLGGRGALHGRIKALPERGPLWQAAVLLAGALSALGFAPLSLWPLTLLALSFLIERGFKAARAWDAFGLGWCFGLGHFGVSLNWAAEAFNHQHAMPAWLGWLGVVLLSGYLALYPGLACALAWRLSRGSRPGWVLLLAASWMLFEWARSVVLGGFAWNPLAVIWLSLPRVAQLDQWGGPYALSGLAVLAAGAFWQALQPRRLNAARMAPAVTLIGSVILLILLNGQRPPARASAASIPVHVVQPNISEDEAHDADPSVNLARYLALSGQAHTAPRLLLWPEGALDKILDAAYAPLLPKDFMSPLELARALRAGDVLLTGGPSLLMDKDGNVAAQHNSVFAVTSEQQVLWRYDKAHLVPFGEFLPARPLLSRLGLSPLVPGREEEFSPGPGPRTFDIPGFTVRGQPLTVGVAICYEIIFPGRVIDAAHRPAFVFNPSSDAWFGSWGPPQHLAQAQLRAIEEGLPVIRATPNGISAVISPQGEILRQLARGQAGSIDIELPQALPPALFARLGVWTSGIVGLLLGAAGLGLSGRGRPTATS